MHPLLYRRQFLLGPRPVDDLPDAWQRLAVAGGRTLHAHPDLLVTQRERGGVELTLLGFAIDPHHPARDDADVLDDLLDRAGRAADVLEKTDHLGGRWALVAVDGDDALIFHDASGFRQVTHADDGGIWTASQPLLLQRAVDLAPDEEALAEFVSTPFFQKNREAWWPGDRTRYAGVRALLPNHVLDLDTGAVRRFWPYAPLRPNTFEGGVERGTAILQGMMAGAHRRFPLTVAMTAGLDSRLQLAACRDIAREVSFFTHLHYGYDATHVDAAVSAKLLGRLGLEHRLIQCLTPKEFRTSADPDVAAYRDLYLANTSMSHVGWGSISHAMSREVPEGHVVVKANCNETTRHRFRVRSGDEGSAADTLAQTMTGLMGMDGIDFATRAFRDWAVASIDPIEAYGYDAYDLAFWEQRSGRWQAGDQLERDLDHETFVPFNSREYFTALLGVPAEYRRAPEPLHRAMIRAMWPEALRVPINPLTPKQKVRAAARRVLVATGTLDTVKRFVRGSRSR